MKKYNLFILLIYLVFNHAASFAQNDLMNLKKYWWYRHRLVNDYLAVGDCQGCSLPMGQRDGNGAAEARWGDNTINLGNYIAVLATEYAMQKLNSQPTDTTVKELYYALKAFNRLDYEAESSIRCATCPLTQLPDDLNGFFMRDDVSEDFLDEHPNLKPGVTSDKQVVNVRSDFNDRVNGGNGGLVSHDQIWAIYMGCALVSKYVSGTETYLGMALRQEARNIAQRIIAPIQANAWVIRNPVTHLDLSNAAGGQIFEFAQGMAEDYCFIKNGNVTPSAIYPVHSCDDYRDAITIANTPIWNDYGKPYAAPLLDAMGDEEFKVQIIAAMGNSWWTSTAPFHPDPITVTHIIFNLDNILHPWTMITELLAQAPIFPANVTASELAARASVREYQHLPLLRQVLHGGGNPLEPGYSYTNLLNTAPCEGPSCYASTVGSAPYEWSTSNRLHKPDERGGGGDAANNYGEFNGLDYMLYYNLYTLAHGAHAGPSTTYLNYKDRKITYNFPVGSVGTLSNPTVIEGFNTVTASNTLNSTAGVTYRAGTQIYLTPGFHIVPGADFHAYIDPFECSASGNTYERTVGPSGSSAGIKTVSAYPEQTTFVKYPKDDVNDEPVSENPKSVTHTMEKQENSLNSSLSSGKNNVVSIYPNPTSGKFTVMIKSEVVNAKLTLMNVFGIEVLTQQATTQSTSIDISDQPKGIYYLKTENGTDKTSVQKLIYQ